MPKDESAVKPWMVGEDGNPHFQRWVASEQCSEPAVGGLRNDYIAETLSNADRLRFWRHKQRCLACSVALSNRKFIEAAAEFTGRAVDDPELEAYIVEVECPMPAALFAMMPDLITFPPGGNVLPPRRKVQRRR